MSKRTKTIDWIERKIVFVLSKESGEISDAGLAGMVLRGDNRIEEDSFDVAIEILVTRRVVGRGWGDDGRKRYFLAA